jgi:hypothetical protein
MGGSDLTLAVHDGDPGQLIQAWQGLAHLAVQSQQSRQLLLTVFTLSEGCSHIDTRGRYQVMASTSQPIDEDNLLLEKSTGINILEPPSKQAANSLVAILCLKGTMSLAADDFRSRGGATFRVLRGLGSDKPLRELGWAVLLRQGILHFFHHVGFQHVVGGREGHALHHLVQLSSGLAHVLALLLAERYFEQHGNGVRCRGHP